ncbi:MAG: hypothetical protein QOE56_1438 [Solirubrobacterales bacterium]|nr:hypothetical protein [Solirubrobacterales bacterium]
MAALLACGDGAALSHRSAAALFGIGEERELEPGGGGKELGRSTEERTLEPGGGLIEITVRRRGEHHRPGIKVRARPSLPNQDVGTFTAIPVTSPVRTFLDLATELPANRLERAINEADKHDLIDPDALRKALGSRAGEPGVRPLRRVLDKHTFRLSDDELEVLFRPLAAAAGLPTPLTKQIVDRFEVDFYWPELGLVVETDGWRYHRTPSAQTRDALRFQAHTAAGRTPLRFSHWQVKYDPAHVKDILTRTVDRLPPAPSARRP